MIDNVNRFSPNSRNFTNPYLLASQFQGTSEANKCTQIHGIADSDKSRSAKKVSPSECQTCKNRKYQDASDEMVSFKSAAHISPSAAGSVVRSHEQEHVSNAFNKAYMGGGKVVRASVSLHTSICPECGRSYISGGTTTTAISYNNDAYSNNRKKYDAEATSGNSIDYTV